MPALMPGPNEFSAEEEKAMRQQRSAPLPPDKNTYDADTMMKNRDAEQRGNITRTEDI